MATSFGWHFTVNKPLEAQLPAAQPQSSGSYLMHWVSICFTVFLA